MPTGCTAPWLSRISWPTSGCCGHPTQGSGVQLIRLSSWHKQQHKQNRDSCIFYATLCERCLCIHLLTSMAFKVSKYRSRVTDLPLPSYITICGFFTIVLFVCGTAIATTVSTICFSAKTYGTKHNFTTYVNACSYLWQGGNKKYKETTQVLYLCPSLIGHTMRGGGRRRKLSRTVVCA